MQRLLTIALAIVLALTPMFGRAASASPPGQTLVVFGDSQAQGVAAALRRRFRAEPGWLMQDRSKPGTSIGQPAGYDWPAALAAYAAGPHAAVAVVMIGGNDRLPMHLDDGSVLAFRSAAWRAEYLKRVRAMLASLDGAGMDVVWLGNPVCREARYSADMAWLNAIVQEALSDGGGRYVSLWSVVADADGQFIAYAPGPDGGTERMRLDDGIHFTPAGYSLMAARVMSVVDAAEMASAGPARAE